MSTTMTGLMNYHQQQQQEMRMEKNAMGCMANFFSLSNILSTRRPHLKRLPSPPGFDSSSEAASSIGSPGYSTELAKTPQKPKPSPPERKTPSPPKTQIHTKANSSAVSTEKSHPVPGFEIKEVVRSPWKFAREAPRLSLDSRFVVDAKGCLHPKEIRQSTTSPVSGDETRRSPSVVARLMGLEPPSNGSGTEPDKRVELRRSASESRSRDLIHYPFIDSNYNSVSNSIAREFNSIDQSRIAHRMNANTPKSNQTEYTKNTGTLRTERFQGQRQAMQQQHKIFYDAADFFPEPKQTASIYGDEIERKMKARGVSYESPMSKDLEKLNQILEAIQVKGLLHSKPTAEQSDRRNRVVDARRFSGDSSPIVVMKPGRPHVAKRSTTNEPPLLPSSASKATNRRYVNESSPPAGTPRPLVRRNGSRSSSPEVTRRKPAMNVEVRGEKESGAVERRRGSPMQSPRRSDQTTLARSPRGRRSTGEICRSEKPTVVMQMDESSMVSEGSYSACSHTDAEWKMEEYGEGRSLLERCDRLLSSIAEMTASSKAATITELQPSPVSVLESSCSREEDDSPSPVMKRIIDFKEVDHPMELEDESWSPLSSVVHSNESDDSEFAYVAQILRAWEYFPGDTNRFLLLEKQQLLRGKDASESSRIQRRLIFDTVTELLDHKQQLPPLKLTSLSINSVLGKLSLSEIWSEYKRIREPGSFDDMLDSICGVLKRDLAKDSTTGWDGWSVETSDMVLDVERLIFKDLIGETIRDLAALVGKIAAPRRKLAF